MPTKENKTKKIGKKLDLMVIAEVSERRQQLGHQTTSRKETPAQQSSLPLQQ